MKKTILAVACLLLSMSPALATDYAVVSPANEFPTGAYGPGLFGGSFLSWASGEVEGGYLYLFTTNTYRSNAPPPGECSYILSDGTTRRIGEQVVAYRGSDTFANLTASPPSFTRYRTVSPCFDDEAVHHTGAYGGGSVVYVPGKAKFYITVNRTRIQSSVPGSTGTSWSAGDFDQIFIGAKDSLQTAVNTDVASPAFAWRLSPFLQYTANLTDPTNGMAADFTWLPPILAAYDSSVASLPIFAGHTVPSPVLWGFMEFGPVAGLPNRLAAVLVTDTSTTVRPTATSLYYKSGGTWRAVNANGTFPTVPDDVSAGLGGSFDISDLRLDPLVGKWKLWGAEFTSGATAGCDDGQTGDQQLVYVQLDTLQRTALWPSRNALGRMTAMAHYAFAPACNCTREFILYSSTDRACFDYFSHWSTISRWWGFEVLIRRRLDGPPS